MDEEEIFRDAGFSDDLRGLTATRGALHFRRFQRKQEN
jgi:hypothetical protein